MAARWAFRCYVSEAGVDEIRAWHDAETKQAQARFLSRLRALAQLPLSEWNEKLYKQLHGECAGLAEIRFLANNVQQRPLGFRSGESEFTILFCAIEKGGKFVPASACEKALRRKSEVLQNSERTNALWLALE